MLKNYLTKIVLQRQCVRGKCTQTVNKLTEISKPLNILSKKYYGQPVHETHPHLIENGYILPKITTSELQERRQKLVDLIMGQSPKSATNVKQQLIVIPSASKKYMSENIPYVFRQNSDFLYLSGCQEPDSCLLIEIGEYSTQSKAILFMREHDSHSEIWDGPRTGPENAARLFGVDEALPISDLSSYISTRMKASCRIWYDAKNAAPSNLNLNLNSIMNSPKSFIHRLRLFKSPAEISLMEESCNIASNAIVNCMKMSKAGINEHELFAQIEYDSKMNGAEFLAYPPVIAGGERSTIIHYINNNQIVGNDEMVLMDAGCEYHGYASDITRTWPVNKTFTNEQRELYEVVLSVQSKLIQELRTFPTLDALFDSMCIQLGKHLQEISIIPKSETIEKATRAAYEFCPHHVSHYLGMDVHDTSSILRNNSVQPGMVVTVEPGIYINHKMKVPDEYKGIGIRIEDDVLITENGPVVLSRNCPKAICDIENIMSYNR